MCFMLIAVTAVELACICERLGVDDPLALLPFSNVFHLGMEPLLGDLMLCMRLNEILAYLWHNKQNN